MKTAVEWADEIGEDADAFDDKTDAEVKAHAIKTFCAIQADALETALDVCAIVPGNEGDPGIDRCMAAIRKLIPGGK